MSWTTPRTYTTGEVITAAILNTDHRDNLNAIANGEKGVPANGIIFLNSTTIPTGWTEDTATRGRVIVGMPASGTLAGTEGSALTDREDRSHTHTGPSHTHSFNDEGGGTGSGTSGGTPVVANASNTDSRNLTVSTGAGTTGWIIKTGTRAGGTGNTGATAISASAGLPYIQYVAIKKS